jgi:uncharacterized membrane protein
MTAAFLASLVEVVEVIETLTVVLAWGRQVSSDWKQVRRIRVSR